MIIVRGELAVPETFLELKSPVTEPCRVHCDYPTHLPGGSGQLPGLISAIPQPYGYGISFLYCCPGDPGGDIFSIARRVMLREGSSGPKSQVFQYFSNLQTLARNQINFMKI